jgi:hypothetical protein
MTGTKELTTQNTGKDIEQEFSFMADENTKQDSYGNY